MMDLERLDSAIDSFRNDAAKQWLYENPKVEALLDAARAYRDLLANGEREFPTDEDVEAAARAWCEVNGHFFDSCGWSEQHLDHARAALQAIADARRTEEGM